MKSFIAIALYAAAAMAAAHPRAGTDPILRRETQVCCVRKHPLFTLREHYPKLKTQLQKTGCGPLAGLQLCSAGDPACAQGFTCKSNTVRVKTQSSHFNS